MIHSAREFLSELLEGVRPTAERLREMPKAVPRTESLWLEWKSGRIAGNKRLNQEVRAAAVAFANAEGGVLVLGFDEKTGSFDDFASPGGNPESWAATTLSELALLPGPKIYPVDVDGHRVLVIAVPRADSLVWCVERGQPKYFFRMWDKNVEAPNYLALDLLTGRRQRANLVPFLRVADINRVDYGTQNLAQTYRTGLELSIGNDSLIFSDETIVGFVSYVARATDLGAIPHHLRERIEFEDPPPFYPFQVQVGLRHWKWTMGTFEPFESRGSLTILLDLPTLNDLRPMRGALNLDTISRDRWPGRLEFGAVLYVLSRATPPLWFQVRVQTIGGQSPDVEVTSVQRTATRPRVFVRFIG